MQKRQYVIKQQKVDLFETNLYIFVIITKHYSLSFIFQCLQSFNAIFKYVLEANKKIFKGCFFIKYRKTFNPLRHRHKYRQIVLLSWKGLALHIFSVSCCAIHL